MGCSHAKLTYEDHIAIEKSRALDRYLADEYMLRNKIVRVLLLGTSEAGKTTFLKQMRILNALKFTKFELETFKRVLRKNIIESMQTLINGAHSFKLKFDSKKNLDVASWLLHVKSDNYDAWDQSMSHNVQLLWADSAIKKTFSCRNKLNLLSSAPYLFEHVGRLGSNEFNPTNEDILRARLQTTGMNVMDIHIHGESFQFIDVGGQRNERKKWIHCFGNVTSVIFISALDEFDQMLREDNEQNRFVESLSVFEDIINNEEFHSSCMILFLNKFDLFEEKLKSINFCDHFKDFTGDPRNSKQTADRIDKFFHERCYAEKKFFITHVTTAVETKNISRVFEASKMKILEDNLTAVGLH